MYVFQETAVSMTDGFTGGRAPDEDLKGFSCNVSGQSANYGDCANLSG